MAKLTLEARNITVKNPESHSGTVGWACLAGFVLAWDVLAPETLSGAVDRALDHPVGRIVAIGGVAVTGAHLLNVLPEAYDPFVQGFNLLDNVRQNLGHDV